jgi:hypothetical protein
MIKVIINEKEYDFPTEWKDITINAYRRLVDIKDLIDHEARIKSICAMASALLGIGIKELYFTTTDEFEKIVNALKFIETDVERKEIGDTVEFMGETYFIKKDLDKLNVGEMVSFEIFCQNETRVVDIVSPSLALILRKDLSVPFDADNYQNFVNSLNDNMDWETATSITTFFLTGAQTSTTDSPLSSTQEKEEAGEEKL